MKAKRFVSVFLAVIMVLSAATLFAQTFPEAKDYANETQANQFRPHSGDTGEIRDFLASVTQNFQNYNYMVSAVAGNSSVLAGVERYFNKLAEFKSLRLVTTAVDKLYSVREADAFTNMRAIAKFKFIGEDANGRLVEYTDSLGLAKLGRETTDWKVWGVLWQDSGIDVSPANLIQFERPVSGEEICVMTTSAGVVRMRLFPQHTPKTVHNFKVLANLGFYDGLPFLRVYENFMIQGGALDGTPEYHLSSYGRLFEDEFSRDLYNFRGALCMGNGGPNTNGNQIYIVQSPVIPDEYLDQSALPLNVEEKYREVGGRAYLDMRYTVFGHVFEGIEIIDTIAKQPADPDGRPTGDPIKILTVRFENYR